MLFDVILGVWSSPMPGGDIESVLDAGWGCPGKKGHRVFQSGSWGELWWRLIVETEEIAVYDPQSP